MSKWEQSLEALESDDTLTVEQYEEWLDAGDGKFYNFHRDYLVATGHAEERERIIKLLEADLCTNSEWGWTDCYGLNKEHCERLKEYIELIKGGTSE